MKYILVFIGLLLSISNFSQGIILVGDVDFVVEETANVELDNNGNFEVLVSNSEYSIPEIKGILNISSDFINNSSATLDLSASSGIITFDGIDAQLIDGSKTIFSKIQLLNDVSLNGEIEISNQIVLLSGSLSLNDNNLKIGQAADIINYSSFNNIISNGIGELSQYITNSYLIFPLATTTSYTPLSIKQNSGISGYFNARLIDGVWSEGTSGTNLSLTEPVVNRTWIIDSEVTPDASIIMQWNEGDEVNDFDRTAALAASYSGGWNLVSASIDGTGPYTAEFTGVSSLDADQPHTLSDDNSPLPVDLISFDISKLGENNLIEWITSYELNCKNYNLYSSSDYQNYDLVGSVSGNYNSNIVSNYSIIDENTYRSEYVYYRLEQIDVNGQKEIIAESYIKNSLIDEISSARIYLNQLIFESNVDLYNSQIEMYSANSKLIYADKVNITKGTNNIDINIPNLSQGIYLVIFKFSNNNKKLIKVNSL